jgi:uncharacterized membrane protein
MHRLAEEDSSRKLSRRARLLLTLGPFVVSGLVVLGTGLLYGWRAAGFMVAVAVASFVGGGKFAILMAAPQSAPLGLWAAAHVVIVGDIITMLVLMANMHVLYRAPWVGKKLAQAHEASAYVLRANPWMRRAAWFGLAIFIAVPFQGTGAVGGTILARLLGMSQFAVLTAIPVGSALGCYPIALLGMYGRAKGLQQIADHPLAAVAFFALLVAVIVLLGRRFTGASLRKREAAPPEAASTNHD